MFIYVGEGHGSGGDESSRNVSYPRLCSFISFGDCWCDCLLFLRRAGLRGVRGWAAVEAFL